MDREAVIQEIADVLAVLEECSESDIESTKRFLRWMPDASLQDMRDKHKRALETAV
jgi:hypothetical protein